MDKSFDEKCSILDTKIKQLEDEYEEIFGEPSSSEQVEEMYNYVLDNLTKEEAETLDEYNKRWEIYE